MDHHERAIERFTDRLATADTTLGVVVVGSVARGEERPDSDVDVYLVVTEDEFHRARAAKRLSYVTSEDVDYEGGYVDVKVASIDYLRRAVPTTSPVDSSRRASRERSPSPTRRQSASRSCGRTPQPAAASTCGRAAPDPRRSTPTSAGS